MVVARAFVRSVTSMAFSEDNLGFTVLRSLLALHFLDFLFDGFQFILELFHVALQLLKFFAR
jgi:hypothetical protein